MSDLNQVLLCGRLTRKPELKHGGANGTAFCKIGIANNTYGGKGKEAKVNFFNITIFGRRAESVCNYLDKGSQVIVRGKLDWNSWEDKEGNKKSSVGIIAEEIQFVGGKGDGKGKSNGNPAPISDENIPDSYGGDDTGIPGKEEWQSPIDSGDEDIPF